MQLKKKILDDSMRHDVLIVFFSHLIHIGSFPTHTNIIEQKQAKRRLDMAGLELASPATGEPGRTRTSLVLVAGVFPIRPHTLGMNDD